MFNLSSSANSCAQSDSRILNRVTKLSRLLRTQMRMKNLTIPQLAQNSKIKYGVIRYNPNLLMSAPATGTTPEELI